MFSAHTSGAVPAREAPRIHFSRENRETLLPSDDIRRGSLASVAPEGCSSTPSVWFGPIPTVCEREQLLCVRLVSRLRQVQVRRPRRCQHAAGHVGRRDSNRLRATPAGRGRPVWRDVAGNLPARNRGHPSRVAALSRERGWDGVRGAEQTQRGESGDTTPWSFERELEDVTALAAAAAPDGPVTLVGSSFGGL